MVLMQLTNLAGRSYRFAAWQADLWLRALSVARTHLPRWSGTCLSFALTGCAATQLNSNTLDLAYSLDSLFKKQALTNLSRLIEDPNVIPSQVDITAGQVQTQTQASGSGTFPIGNQVTRNVATSGTVAVSSILEQVRQLMFGLNNTWQQSWSITPVSDSNALTRLRALYEYVIHVNDIDYLRYYPEISDRCALNHPDQDRISCINNQLLIQDYNLNVIATNNNLVLDSSRLVEPQCVICLTKEFIIARQHDKNARQLTILTNYMDENLPKSFWNVAPETHNYSKVVPTPANSTANGKNSSNASPTNSSTTTTDATGTNQGQNNTAANTKDATTGEALQSGNANSGAGSTTNGVSWSNASNRENSTLNIVQMLQQQANSEFAQTTNNYTQLVINGQNGIDDVNSFYKSLIVSPRLHQGRWLYWRNVYDASRAELPPRNVDITYLGLYENNLLFMKTSDYKKGVLGDFMLFLLPQGDPRLPLPAASAGGGGGGSGGVSGGGGGGSSSGASGSGGAGKSGTSSTGGTTTPSKS